MLDEADRERLNNARAFVVWRDAYDARNLTTANVLAEGAMAWYEKGMVATCTSQAALTHARKEIARLEALDARVLAPDPGWDHVPAFTFKASDLDELTKSSITFNGHKIVFSCGLGDPHDITADVHKAMGLPPTEQSLDAFMREREAKQEAEDHKAWKDEVWPKDPPLDCQEQQPASRELVERMVREATAHSKWPVRVVQDWNGCDVAALAQLPNGRQPLLLGIGGRGMDDYKTLLRCCESARSETDATNARACPTCDGKGKTRGELMWGEQDCHACAGKGVS